MEIEIKGTCQFPGCDEPATDIAYDREKYTIKIYCVVHAQEIVSKENPEYVEGCPNCGCLFGVN